MTDQSSFCVVLCVLPQWVRSCRGRVTPEKPLPVCQRVREEKRPARRSGVTPGDTDSWAGCGSNQSGWVWLQAPPPPTDTEASQGPLWWDKSSQCFHTKVTHPHLTHTHTHTCINIHKHKSHTRKHLQGLISFLFPTAAGVLVGGEPAEGSQEPEPEL